MRAITRIITQRPQQQCVLDMFPGAVLALGTERLSKNYTGPLARLRESVASAELDVGADNRGRLDGSKWGGLVGTSGLNPNNAVSNPNFVNTTGWTGVNSSLSASGNILSCTGSGADKEASVYAVSSIPCVTGKKIYVRILIKPTNAVCTTLAVNARGSTVAGTIQSLTPISNPTQNQEYTMTGVLTLPADSTGSVRLQAYHVYADAGTANGKVAEIRQVIAIDLTTTYGSGAEPTAAWCDANIPFLTNANAYESIHYDQSGNANNALQTTAANQPMIVMSGSLLDGVKFDDTNDSLKVTKHATINDLANLTFHWVGRFNGLGGGGVGRILEKTDGATASLGRHLLLLSASMCLRLNQWNTAAGIAIHDTPNNSIVYNKLYHFVVCYNNASMANIPDIYINGAKQAITTSGASTGTVSADASVDLYIGNRSAGDRAGNLTQKECALWNRLFTAADVSKLWQYAQKKYGI